MRTSAPSKHGMSNVKVRKISVNGRQKQTLLNSYKDLTSFSLRVRKPSYYSIKSTPALNRTESFVCYDSDESDTSEGYDYWDSRNVTDYIINRESNSPTTRLAPSVIDHGFGTKRMLENDLFKEFEIDSSELQINKAFCSQWISEREVAFGTKCNKLMVYDIITRRLMHIPNLKSTDTSLRPDSECGKHSLKLNPSKTMLATGALHTNDVAIYRLPSMDPICVGQEAHSDWIFDIVWLDDDFFVTGSRDGKLALWRVDEDLIPGDDEENLMPPKEKRQRVDQLEVSKAPCIPRHYFAQALTVKNCNNADKIRALTFNSNKEELIALSLDSSLHLWDCRTFKQMYSRKLQNCSENVCMAVNDNCSLYAVGSKSQVFLLDSRTLQNVGKVNTQLSHRLQSDHGCSTRSVLFTGNTLSMGTGSGSVMFYDVRARRFYDRLQPSAMQTSSSCDLNSVLASFLSRRRSESSLTFSGSTLRARMENEDEAERIRLGGKPVILNSSRGWVMRDEVYLDLYSDVAYYPAIYTHCFDSTGMRLFTGGGPLPASLFGNYCALWK